MIRPVYKPIGPTTHQLAIHAAEIFPKKLTHTGSLDPMAHGVVTLLIGDDRYRKQQLSPERKSYRFQIVAGIQTDSQDMLGLITAQDLNKHHVEMSDDPSIIQLREDIQQALEALPTTFSQQLPRFSARRIDGESYFDKARREEQFEPDTERVTLQRASVVGSQLVHLQNIAKKADRYIPEIQGDFRQEEILQQWHELATSHPDSTLPVITVEVTVGKRFYIRALVRDLAKKLGVPLFTFDLERIADGDNTTADCVCLL